VEEKKKSYPDDHMQAEMDSHADTCAFGLCCKVIYDTGKHVSVEGHNGQSTLRLKDIKIVSVVPSLITLSFCYSIKGFTSQQ
jgi:hypothetical protein